MSSCTPFSLPSGPVLVKGSIIVPQCCPFLNLPVYVQDVAHDAEICVAVYLWSILAPVGNLIEQFQEVWRCSTLSNDMINIATLAEY